MTWSLSRPAVHRNGTTPAPPSTRWAPEDLAYRKTPTHSEAIAAEIAAHHVIPDAGPTPEEIAQAQHDAQLAEAYAQGFEEGRVEGELAEQARLRSSVAAAVEALDILREGEARWMGTIEENVCALAVAVARHVIGREVADDAGVVRALVQKALEEFPIDQPLRIRVHPQDLSLLQRADTDGDPMGAMTPGREARWVADHLISPGGCVVEGRERIVDGRVDTALERLYRRLTYTDA
jgi:flagellar biosynthesis/type III secretory pathway protein FliH